MESLIISLLAETFIHPGAGQNMGAIDLPVARESATGFPFIAGSSFKGSLRDFAEQQYQGGEKHPEIRKIFGSQESEEGATSPVGAGALLVSDARLLLLPVRSLSGPYKWATCPQLLERYLRDSRRSGRELALTAPTVSEGKVLCEGAGRVFLEELSFQADPLPPDWAPELKKLIRHQDTQNRLCHQLAILSDQDFAWFTQYGLAVQARNQLDEKKTSQNLWYEESLPPDTLFYAVLAERTTGILKKVQGWFEGRPYLQVGGGETVGQGWCAVTFPEVSNG